MYFYPHQRMRTLHEKFTFLKYYSNKKYLNAAHAAFASNFNGASHTEMCIQVAGTEMTVPAFEHAELFNFFRTCVNIHVSFFDVFHETGKAILIKQHSGRRSDRFACNDIFGLFTKDSINSVNVQ